MVAQYNIELDTDRHPLMVREREVPVASEHIRSPQEAAALLQEVFHAGKQAEEHLYMISLDIRKQVLALFDVCHGQADSCLAGSREVFLRALISGAISIILAHNHPSGICSPSSQDTELTSHMQSAGNIVGIRLDDHIILGSDGTYYSFLEAGRLA